MAALIEELAPRQRGAGPISSFDDWVGLWGLDSLPLMLQTTMGRQEEPSDGTFFGLVTSAYLRNSVVFASLAIRARLFSEARFQFQQMRRGRPGALFGTPELGILENPEPGKTTRDMLQGAILDADLGGNGILLGRPDAVRRLRPDWITIAYGSKGRATELGAWDPDAEVIGYGYYPGGMASGVSPITFLPEEIAHFTPTKDPLARNRGISLLTAGLREVLADNASTTHKLAFFQNAATPNLALKFPPGMSKDKALEWIELFEQEHKGASKAFKTIFLGAGVEPTPVGLNFQQMDYAKIQGRAETRIAMLTGMHPVVVALSEGLQGSSLNAGNFNSAARLVGDATLRPLWGEIAGDLQRIVPPPPGSRLWYDDRDIPFLREDVKDQAEIVQKNAATIGQLIKDGFTAASAVEYVTSGGDGGVLEHTGLTSVQLQAPLTPGATPPPAPAAFEATRDFWAIDDPFARLGTILAGQTVPPNHPLLATFPSLFQPVETQLQLTTRGGSIDLTAEQVLATRRNLEAAGRDAGYDSLASELGVSRDTIRRRLAAAHQNS
jgi:hypothetical protein